MSKLLWDQVGERLYETGVEQCVLFAMDATGAYTAGVAWNGITNVTHSPDGGDEQAIYADDLKYLSLYSAENFKGKIEAFMYPDEFAICDGSVDLAVGMKAGQQTRRGFGLAYITKIGNDVLEDQYGQKLHIVYNAKVSPSDKSYQTINETPEAMTLSWDFSTTPIPVTGHKPTAHVEIDSTVTTPEKFQSILDIIQGTDVLTSKMPTIEELITILNAV